MADQDSYLGDTVRDVREQVIRLDGSVKNLEVGVVRLEGEIKSVAGAVSSLEKHLAHYATKHDMEASISRLEERMSQKMNRTIIAVAAIATAAVAAIGLFLSGSP